MDNHRYIDMRVRIAEGLGLVQRYGNATAHARSWRPSSSTRR